VQLLVVKFCSTGLHFHSELLQVRIVPNSKRCKLLQPDFLTLCWRLFWSRHNLEKNWEVWTRMVKFSRFVFIRSYCCSVYLHFSYSSILL